MAHADGWSAVRRACGKTFVAEHPVAMDRTTLALHEAEQADEYQREHESAPATLTRPGADRERNTIPMTSSEPHPPMGILEFADMAEQIADHLGPNRGLRHDTRMLAWKIRQEFRGVQA